MAYNPEPLAKISVIKFKGQDFNSLRDHCLSRGLLFEDETFPAGISSIGMKLLQRVSSSSLKWRRPKDLLGCKSEPHFILEGASRFDIQQGEAGDCWFLAALGSLTQNPQHLQKILKNQSFSSQYAGIFCFRFWKCGHWVEVVVDDRLPVGDNGCLFVHPFYRNHEFWPCLLEKAYANVLSTRNQNNCGKSRKADTQTQQGIIMIKGDDSRMENGLVSQHAYTVTGAEQIQYRRGWEALIRLWNPWGHTEWQGRWSDRSLEWRETQDRRKSQLYEDKDNGEFWMSCQDFQENFSCLYICNEFPINLDHGNMTQGGWSQEMFKDHIEGPQKDAQYFFSVSESTENNNVIVSFNIMPESLQAKEYPLGFQVYKVDPKFQHFRERLPPTFFSPLRNPCNGIKTKTKWNFTKCFTLSPGTYVVAVSVWREVEFLLRIFQKMPGSDRNMGTNFNPRTLKAGLPENGSQQSVFYKYAQQGQNIDATQLQSLLNQELLTGLPEDAFSLDECRSIVALMDLKVNGLLNQGEFSRLWSRLVCCQSVFQNIQKNSGVFLSSDLREAIRNTGKAGDPLSPDDWGPVPILLLLFILETFQNLSKDGKGLYVTQTEWMNLVMYS
ncbi:PREDICTED: calpain-13 [Hipposideros armiger]|uniref:Calpain-13 n=1 Tax=Hipposideros armiger TaxID=186990 RepID=A0A8B7TDL7_HIPAR|nr:PREDICTED: calpain-13 [Hipposideros armiger]